MFGRGTGTTRRRSRGAALLLIALLPGWVLPPSCAACPHSAGEAAHDPAHAEGHPAGHDGGHHRAHADRDAHADHPGLPEESHDCGCPCDVQCVAPGLPSPDAVAAGPSTDGDAPSRILSATVLRAGAPRFPPFFLPLSTAPPR